MWFLAIIIYYFKWLRVNVTSSTLYTVDNDDAYFQSMKFIGLLCVGTKHVWMCFYTLFRIIYYFRTSYSFIFIWQTTLSKRHLDQKFHGMFVSLHNPCSVVLYPFDHKFSKLCINHWDGARAKPFCAPLPAVCIVVNSYTQL